MSKLSLSEIVNLLNTELYRLHNAGESVIVNTNGYCLKLRENELVKIAISVNNCTHKWTPCKGPIDMDKGGPESYFDWCKLCGMTKEKNEEH